MRARSPDAPGTPADLARIEALLGVLGGYALIPALKAIMAQLDRDPAWLRVRPPLVATTPDRSAELERQLRAVALDPARD